MDEKFIIASDIHGSAFWCEKLLAFAEKIEPTKLVLLGDLLYHGPRNPLPVGHDAKTVFELLNAWKDKILAVRGNCDAEVDQMVLEFPALADYALLNAGGKTLYLTHGHLAGENNPPPLSKAEILLNGHTHYPVHRTLENGILYANCGSVALPKAGTPHSCILFENGEFLWIDLETQEVFDRVTL